MAAGSPSSNEYTHVVSLHGRDSGLLQFEVELVSLLGPASTFIIGLTKSNPPSVYMRRGAAAMLWNKNGNIEAIAPVSPTVSYFAAGALTVGTVIRGAINFTTGKVWLGLVGGAWVNAGDPVAGTLPTFTIPPGAYYVTACAGGTLESSNWGVRLRTKASQFTGPALTGFTPWAEGATAATEPSNDLVFGFHGDGANGGAVFTDSSRWGHALTVTGTVTTVTDGAAFGGSAIQFTGTGNLQTGAAPELYLPNGTISGFFTFDSGNINSGSNRPLFDYAQGFQHKLVARANKTGNDLTVVTAYIDPNGIICPVTWVAGQRHHVEVGWGGGTTYVFFDGVLVGTQASVPLDTTTAVIWLNAENLGGPGGANPVTHRLDDFAVWATLRHTANFTPPTATDF